MTDLHARLALCETPTDKLDDIDLRLRSPMVTYKENATEDAPLILAALRKVLELHKLDDQEECAVCMNQEGDPLMWPCPTVKAIEEEMSGASN